VAGYDVLTDALGRRRRTTMRQLHRFFPAHVALPLVAIALLLACGSGKADTLEWALVQAYQNNPSLNAQRASLRATDENVPQALSGYRPKLSATASGGYNFTNSTSVIPLGGIASASTYGETFLSRSVGATGSYTLFNGYQTANKTRQAESQVQAARETLRVTEQQVLLDAATAYMNLLRDKAVVDLNRRNVEVLTEQLRQTRVRLQVGELTPTDVAQSASRLAAARMTLLGVESNYATSQANYRRVIGVEAGRLAPGTPVDRMSPNTLAKAIAQGQEQSPSVLAAAYGVDVAELAVKVSEGALYPSLILTGSVSQGTYPAYEVIRETQASVLGALTVPIYQGGAEYSAIRQAKETLGQQRLNLDVNRDQARATVAQSWAQLNAAKAQIEGATAEVNAAEVALDGVRGEARVGQRTTIDVLNAQQELVNARVAVVTAQHDRVVASYTLLAAVGSLSMQHLGLNVLIYDPMVHYQQVRDAWMGVRNPDGR
jgi:outer membrane protein